MKTIKRLFRPLRVWWRILQLHRRGLKTSVHHMNGHVLVHVYDVSLKDVLVF